MEQFRKSGDLQVLGTLFERYMDLVYGVCLKYFENREDARDGVTGIFEKLIDEVPRHKIATFKSWLYVLTKNYCLMKLRSEKSVRQQKEKWEKEQDFFVESEEELHPIDKTEPDLDKVLAECIDKLKNEQQRCIRLFYYENRSYSEIAAELSLEEKKVKSHIQNGKRNLKICIENNNEKRRET